MSFYIFMNIYFYHTISYTYFSCGI